MILFLVGIVSFGCGIVLGWFLRDLKGNGEPESGG